MVQQMLTFYELDLGLNHVVRKYNEPLEDQANLLIAGEYGVCAFISIVVLTSVIIIIMMLCSAWGQ